MLRRHFAFLPVLPALSWLGACASQTSNPSMTNAMNGYSTQALLGLLPRDAILLGEQHDAADHQTIHWLATEALAERGLLAALVLEMAEAGRSTMGLAPDALEAEVKRSLAWNDRSWNWARYGPAIMAAVRAGVVVLGANLAREQMSAAMRDASHDKRLTSAALKQQQQDIREGHCDLLPESQILPMTRVQIARDASMAQTVQAQSRTGKTVLLLAGAAHVDRMAGVPVHWKASFQSISIRLRPSDGAAAGGEGHFDLVWRTQAMGFRDYCAEFRQRLKPAPASP